MFNASTSHLLFLEDLFLFYGMVEKAFLMNIKNTILRKSLFKNFIPQTKVDMRKKIDHKQTMQMMDTRDISAKTFKVL